MPVRKIPGSTLTYAVIFRQETDGRWVYGTDDGSLDPRMAAMVGHLLEVWPSSRGGGPTGAKAAAGLCRRPYRGDVPRRRTT
jgi:hypothetical protein